MRDLLSKDQKTKLEVREQADKGVYVKDLSSFVCKSVKEIEHVMNVGNQNRSIGSAIPQLELETFIRLVSFFSSCT